MSRFNDETIRPGEWIKATAFLPGDTTPLVHMAVVEDVPNADDWLPAFFEDGAYMVRTPIVPDGVYWLWIRLGTSISADRVRMVNVQR